MCVRISTVNEYTLKCPTIPHPPYVYKYAACHHYNYTQYNLHLPSLNLNIPSPIFYTYHFLPLSPRSLLHGPYTGEFQGHTHSYPHTHTHYRTNLRVSKLVQFSLQFQLPLWKKLSPVHSSRWETLF